MDDDDAPIGDARDPLALFDAWFEAAGGTEPNDPNAVYVATATADGTPSVRTVLLKAHDGRGFVFYTNFGSRKGGEIAANPRASLLFHWKTQRRQVRIEGTLAPVADDEADRYYASRDRVSRLGAHASLQSQPLDRRETLIARLADADARYGSDEIPRPAHWSGFRLAPCRFEFWQDMPHRLHDRLVFEPTEAGHGWSTHRIYP